MMPSRRRLIASLAGAAALLGGCGFKLRESPSFDFRTLYANFPAHSRLGAELQRNLASAGGVTVISDAKRLNEAQVILDVLTDQREKVVTASTAAGQVREFQLRVRFRFKARGRDGRELIPETELLQQRDFSYSESAALAKEAEEALLYRDMQTDVVNQVLRRLSTLRVG